MSGRTDDMYHSREKVTHYILMEERCVLGNVQRWQITEDVRSHMGDTYAVANGHVSTTMPPFLALVVKVSSSSRVWSARFVVS